MSNEERIDAHIVSFSDAFISSAEYKGKLMTEIQLEELNNDGDFLYESIQNSLF